MKEKISSRLLDIVRYNEKGIHAYVTMEIEDNSPYYSELREYERTLFAKGPSFIPILLLVIIAFSLLSTFVILFAQQKRSREHRLWFPFRI